MELQEDKKTSLILITHWTNKFDRAIRILLKNGIKPEVLMEKLKAIINEQN